MVETSRPLTTPSVFLSQDQWATYGRLARSLRVSHAELVRHALEVYALLRAEIRQGAIVLVRHPDGNIDRVVGI